ncbi:hypothetical protein FQA39_LY12052 [Lamprigera yunnana]|nr:hypothetical protein FQA39_LY12052 [Lamprigera yunnana]
MEDNLKVNYSAFICRACLTEDGDFQSVFEYEENCGLTIQLSEMIMTYTSLQIMLGDGLPEQICSTCAKTVVQMYLFKQQCEESDSTLRNEINRHANKVYITEEHQLTAEALNIDPYLIDVVVKPEVGTENDEIILNNDISTLNVQDNHETHIVASKDRSGEEESDVKVDEKFICDICYDVFSRVSHLNKHKKVHSMLNEYVCNMCNNSFAQKDLLLRHLETHEIKLEEQLSQFEMILREESVSPFECVATSKIEESFDKNDSDKSDLVLKHFCGLCNKGFINLESVLQHQGIHKAKSERALNKGILIKKVINENNIGNVNLKCVPCNLEFVRKRDFTAHLSIHKSRRKMGELICHMCKRVFCKTSHLMRHMKIHDTVKANVCTLCNKGFTRKEQLVHHMNAHSGIKPHTCNICNKGFNQISNLKDHMRTHNGEKPFLCSSCGKGFNQLGNLRQHTIRHSGVKAHLCNTCGSGFASKGELSAHLRKHTGARPFVCPICNHGFTTSSSLTKHKRIHSGEKPYECEMCKMKFSRSGILARHKRTHTGEKPYVCTYCTKAFSQSNDLNSHLRIHTGEKPFICDICGQAFRQSTALKTHKKIHIDRSVDESRLLV